MLVFGVGAVSVADAIGAIASRRMNFSFSYFSFITFGIYIFVGYIGAKLIDTTAGVTFAGLTALYDSVIGWKISSALDANWGDLQEFLEEELENDPGPGAVVLSVIFGMILGAIGTFFA